jgi:hypothetical protein
MVGVVGRLGEAGMSGISMDWGDWRWGTWMGEWSWVAEDDLKSVLLRWDGKDGAGIATMTKAGAGSAAPIGLFASARRSFTTKA